jgi:endopeptidase La
MTEEIKKYKLFYLQKKYNNLVCVLNNLEKHYNYLIAERMNENINNFSNSIYEIVKNLNSHYNYYINSYFDNMNTDIDMIANNCETTNILKIIDTYHNDIPSDAFGETENDIKRLIKENGYHSIIEMLYILYGERNSIINTIGEMLRELDEIVVPIGYNVISSKLIDAPYYWKIPSKFNIDDILCKKRELWIRLKENTYMKVNLFFKVDRFSTKTKTTQLKSPILQKNKNNIMTKIENNNIDIRFVKSFIRHDYLGNIYCMSDSEYIDYITKSYYRYTKLSESTFVNIMKDFSGLENIKQMYDTVFLLLQGNDDAVDIAGLLMGLIREKKNHKMTHIYDYIVNNMTFYIESKIKRSNNNIKTSLEKIKSISIEDVDYKKQLAINKNIPDNIKAMVLEKIDEMKQFNNEYYKQQLYVRTILNFPWGSPNDDMYYESLNKNKKTAMNYLTSVEDKLKKSCYGHDEAKRYLLQMIGKWISNPSSAGTCFGLVGPPGVGKTLLAKSISKALDIPFGQITLGGQNDGELLHGHGYTYSGSQPGMIIKKMVEMGKSRCILYFDELDKACSKHGTTNEITSILIHLTDPNMNQTFQDRFFQGIEFPLDKVIMIFSYNDSSLVDPILLDRIKEIKVQPYTMEDKLNICTQYIVPEMAENVSMDDMVNINDSIISYMVDNYTNEAGVRDIKRKIEEIYLHLNIDMIYSRGLFKQPKKKIKQITLTQKDITDILKEPDMHKRDINDKPEVGIIAGLYATSNGSGGITPIQIYPNMQHSNDKYEIKLTGKQGEIMKESVICSLTTAIEWLKNNNYNVEELMKHHVKNGFHVHTPDGATPKDGPSAGCAFTCAFISRILNRPIKNDIAMTGEIELTGKISKIGGLEFKLQGAKKAGIKTVYVPFENKKDVEEIKTKYKNLIDDSFIVKTVSEINEIVNEILI